MSLGVLTEKDFETIMEALDAYEQQPEEKAATRAFVDMAGAPPDQRERIVRVTMDKAKAECATRKRMLILLRAKVEIARQAAQAAGIEAAAAKGDA